jgi:hypothetical protein
MLIGLGKAGDTNGPYIQQADGSWVFNAALYAQLQANAPVSQGSNQQSNAPTVEIVPPTNPNYYSVTDPATQGNMVAANARLNLEWANNWQLYHNATEGGTGVQPTYIPYDYSLPTYIGGQSVLDAMATVPVVQSYATVTPPTQNAQQVTTPNSTSQGSTKMGVSFSFMNASGGSASAFLVGDNWSVMISGALANSAVTVSGSGPGGPFSGVNQGTTDNNGWFSITRLIDSTAVGSWSEQWYVGGVLVGSVSFTVAQPSTTQAAQTTTTTTAAANTTTSSAASANTGGGATTSTFMTDFMAGFYDAFTPSMWSDVLANGTEGEKVGLFAPIALAGIVAYMFMSGGRHAR